MPSMLPRIFPFISLRMRSMTRPSISSEFRAVGNSSCSSTRPPKSEVATIVCVVPTAMPTATGPAARRRRRVGGLPPVDSPSISSTSPSSINSPTISETVERCRAVSCAISAREIGALSRT